MPAGLTLDVYSLPESWSDADRAEWEDALLSHGFERANGEWIAPGFTPTERIPFSSRVRPEAGAFSFTISPAALAQAPQHAVSVLAGLARLLGERVECRFGVSHADATPAVAPESGSRARLGLVTILGGDLVADVGAARFDGVPGLKVEPLGFGALLLVLPVDSLPLAWRDDATPFLADATRHLGLDDWRAPTRPIVALLEAERPPERAE